MAPPLSAFRTIYTLQDFDASHLKVYDNNFREIKDVISADITRSELVNINALKSSQIFHVTYDSMDVAATSGSQTSILKAIQSNLSLAQAGNIQQAVSAAATSFNQHTNSASASTLNPCRSYYSNIDSDFKDLSIQADPKINLGIYSPVTLVSADVRYKTLSFSDGSQVKVNFYAYFDTNYEIVAYTDPGIIPSGAAIANNAWFPSTHHPSQATTSSIPTATQNGVGVMGSQIIAQINYNQPSKFKYKIQRKDLSTPQYITNTRAVSLDSCECGAYKTFGANRGDRTHSSWCPWSK